MKRGALLFAFNNDAIDYYTMAVKTAKRINHFLNLPVTIVTDKTTPNNNYQFDKVINVAGDLSNFRDEKIWINKGRYQAYQFSPYDETLLLDTDYLVNSDKLLSAFDYCEDFCFHQNAKYLMFKEAGSDLIGTNTFLTYWATVIVFKKTHRSNLLFDFIKMVQDNYTHYVTLHNCFSTQYRNDYALTIAARTLNGHIRDKSNFIPWDLLHVSNELQLFSKSDKQFNTEFVSVLKTMSDPFEPEKTTYLEVKDTDLHMLSKKNFLEVV
jgi:hypothetical protein